MRFLTSHEIMQVRNTAMCEPAATVHPHEHLQANARSKPSSQNISNTSDLWGMVQKVSLFLKFHLQFIKQNK